MPTANFLNDESNTDSNVRHFLIAIMGTKRMFYG
jgi:hypothetical protein